MSIERWRKTLQNKSPNWGDPVCPKPYTCPSSRNFLPPLPSGTSASTHPLDTPATAISAAESTSGSSSTHEDQAMPASDQAREQDQRIFDTDGGIQIGASTQLDASAPSSGSDHSKTMPSTKGWSLDTLVSRSPNFRRVERRSATASNLPIVMKEFEDRGEPLVIEGFQDDPKWPKKMFTVEYFTKHTSDEITVRNVHKWTDTTIQVTKFVDKCRSIGPYVEENEQERFYGKDTDCPKRWEEWLQKGDVVPPSLIGHGPEDLFRYLPDSGSVQTLMCYVGIGDTFTPCHKDLCASSGQNLMCYTEDNGSSFWFMTRGSSAAEAAKYFHDLGQELDHENHVITLQELARAPFDIYILEQKLGDLVLVPPRSCHQVVNSGGITIKTSWSRITLKGLLTAYHQELPLYRRVCRPETYRVKSIVYHSLMAQTKELERLLASPSGSRRLKRISRDNVIEPQIADDLKGLLPLFDCILAEEFHPHFAKMPRLVTGSNGIDDEDPITCDFCGADIFQSFFECSKCMEGGPSSGSRLHICPGCYSEGRSCECLSMEPMQFRDFQVLIEIREKAEKVIRLYEERRNQTYILNLDLKNAGVPALFRAAYHLNRIRKKATKTYRTCSMNTPHDCQYHWILSCKKCHHGRCFWHLTTNSKIHSAEALLAHSSDPGCHEAYHKAHQSGNTVFKTTSQALEIAQKQGSRSVGYSQLVYNAINFVHCKPVEPRFMVLGWYDQKYQMAAGVEEAVPSSPQPSASSSEEDMAAVEHAVHPQPDEVNSSIDEMQVEVTFTPKRKLSVYVLVPKAPYSTRQDLDQSNAQLTVENPLTEAIPLKLPKPRSRPLPHSSDKVRTEPPVEAASVSAPGPSRHRTRHSPQVPELAVMHSPESPGPSDYQNRYVPQVSETVIEQSLVAAASTTTGSQLGKRIIETKIDFKVRISSSPEEISKNGAPKRSLSKLHFRRCGQTSAPAQVVPSSDNLEEFNSSFSQYKYSSSPTSPPPMNFSDAHPRVSPEKDLPSRLPLDQTPAPVQPPVANTVDVHLVPHGQEVPMDTFSSHLGLPYDQESTSVLLSSKNSDAQASIPLGHDVLFGLDSHTYNPAGRFIQAVGALLMDLGADLSLPAQYPPNAQANQIQMQPVPMKYGYPHDRHSKSHSHLLSRGRDGKRETRDRNDRGHRARPVPPPNRKPRYEDATQVSRSQGRVHASVGVHSRWDKTHRCHYYPKQPSRRFQHKDHFRPYPPSHPTRTRVLERLSWDREIYDEHGLYVYHQQQARDVTLTPLAPYVPGQTNSKATSVQPNISRSVQKVNSIERANVFPEEPRRAPSKGSVKSLSIVVAHETPAQPSEDFEMRTPIDDLVVVGSDETFPRPRGDSEMDLTPDDRRGSETNPSTEDRSDSEMSLSPVERSNSETGLSLVEGQILNRSPPAEDRNGSGTRPRTPERSVEEDWELDYDQSDEWSPTPIFRTAVVAPARDEDEVSLGDEEQTANYTMDTYTQDRDKEELRFAEELTANHWA